MDGDNVGGGLVEGGSGGSERHSHSRHNSASSKKDGSNPNVISSANGGVGGGEGGDGVALSDWAHKTRGGRVVDMTVLAKDFLEPLSGIRLFQTYFDIFTGNYFAIRFS